MGILSILSWFKAEVSNDSSSSSYLQSSYKFIVLLVVPDLYMLIADYPVSHADFVHVMIIVRDTLYVYSFAWELFNLSNSIWGIRRTFVVIASNSIANLISNWRTTSFDQENLTIAQNFFICLCIVEIGVSIFQFIYITRNKYGASFFKEMKDYEILSIINAIILLIYVFINWITTLLESPCFWNCVFGEGYLVLYTYLVSFVTLSYGYLLFLIQKKRIEGLCERQLIMNLTRKMFPGYAAKQLMEKGVVEPKLHMNTTVFFSDIEDFTAMSSKCSPAQVMSFLNRLYLVMDAVAESFPDLYKVETIGDGYVCSNNILSDVTNAENICQFALLVSKIVEIVKTPLNQNVRIRIGLHSGNIVSGVIGRLMPRFQIFWDTINTASRMEQLGEPYRVHISSATAQLLMTNSNFVLIKRGNIQVKGLGEMETWWLEASKNNKLLSEANVESLKLKYSSEIDFSLSRHTVDDLSTSAHGRAQQRDYIETKLKYLELGLQETVQTV